VPIYLIRHGQSLGNSKHVYQGRMDFPLAEEGVAQAHLLAAWLPARGVVADALFTSPLKRAHQTAEILSRAAGFPEPRIELLIEEYAAGSLEGLTEEEISRQFPEFAGRPLDELGDFAKYGGESYEDMQQRCRQFIAQVQDNFTPEQGVVAVSHGGCLYQLLKLWCGWPAPRHFFTRVTNCCCFRLTLREVQGLRAAQLEWMVPIELMGQPEWRQG
jgi:broad specificity phosphatase PhoE